MNTKRKKKRIEFQADESITDKFDKVIEEAGYNRAEVFTRFMNNVIQNPPELQIQSALSESPLPKK